jgi:PTS system mannose-specific IID component
MQNLGFAMAIIPLIKEWNLSKKETGNLLTRHLQMFNTHPYFSAPVLGSVVNLEKEQLQNENPLNDTVVVKQSLMGPYAAIGDTFFWAALRPFTLLVAVVLAYKGFIVAPFVFLLLYTPAHILVRLKGFIEGYKRGKQGVEFIRIMDLPRWAVKIRWLSLFVLAGAAFWLTFRGYLPIVDSYDITIRLTAMATILLCLLLIKKGISQIIIIYGAAVLFLIMNIFLKNA